MNSLIKRIFVRENIVSILIMVGGLMVIVNNFFDYLTLSNEQKLFLNLTTILTMLALLGIDGFIEKIGFFGKLQAQIEEINSKIEPDPSSIFERRVSKPPFDTLVQDHDTIWLSGTSLVNILSHYGNQIQQYANNGKRFKFLINDPENATLLKIFSKSSPSDETIPELKIRGHRSLSIIKSLQKVTPKGSIEAKVADYLFAQSYFILDGDKPNGVIHIEMYGYKIATGDKLTLTLKCKDNNSSYVHHVEQFKKMWNDAKSL